MAKSINGSEDQEALDQSRQETEAESGQDKLPPLTFLQVLTSTFSAALGVQKKENKERDFTRGNIFHFILAGVIFVVCFIAVIASVVTYVLS